MVMGFLRKKLAKIRSFDVTIFQTPNYGMSTGYEEVARLTIYAESKSKAIDKVYQMCNVSDLLPKDYRARFMTTGDVVILDEGWLGKTQYKLCADGWRKMEIQIVTDATDLWYSG